MPVLDERWVDELAARIAGTDLRDVAPEGELVLQQRIVDGQGGELAFQLRLNRTGGTAAVGRATSPTVTLVQDRATAEAIRDGTLTPQAAVLAGRLRVEGDVTALLAWAPALAAVQQAGGAGGA